MSRTNELTNVQSPSSKEGTAEFTRFFSAFPTSTDQAYSVIVSSSPAALFTNKCRCLIDCNITCDTCVRDLSEFIYSLKIFSVTCHRVATSLHNRTKVVMQDMV